MAPVLRWRPRKRRRPTRGSAGLEKTTNRPTRPTKTTDSRAKGFGDISVELDAIDPNQLRQLVDEAISKHLPPEQFNTLKAAEESERKLINGLVGLLHEAA